VTDGVVAEEMKLLKEKITEQTLLTNFEGGAERVKHFRERAKLETLIGLLEEVDLVENPVRLILDNSISEKILELKNKYREFVSKKSKAKEIIDEKTEKRDG
jgi:hypothetical protein